MTRRKWLAIQVGLTLVVVAAIVVLWLWTHNQALLLTLLPVVVSWVLGSIPRPGPPDDPVALAASRIKKTWDKEAARRGESEVAANTNPAQWERSDAMDAMRSILPQEGDTNELAHRYVKGPFRLLLAGEPGSGKTAFCVALTRELLSRRAKTDPVPVLLQLKDWDRREGLERWIVEQLGTLHNVSRSVARTLLEERRLLPIFDGLDEGPGELADTICRLTDSRLLDDRPFVLTCREQILDAAKVDHLIARDAKVRIVPITSAEIVVMLQKAYDQRPGWSDVIKHLRNSPHGPLAKALNTRLMLFLMMRVTSQSEPPPDRLIGNSGLQNSDAIRDHLIGLFLAIALPEASGRRFIDEKSNERWLRYLAVELCGTDGRLQWWRFYEVLRGSTAFLAVRVVVGALVTAGLCVVLFGLFGYPWLGLTFGAVLGGVGGGVMNLSPVADPKALPPMALRVDEGPWPSWLAALVTGAGGAIAIGYLYQDAIIGVTVGAAIGLGLGLSRRLLTRPTLKDRVLGPDEVLRADRRTVLLAFPVGAVVIGFVGAGLGLVGEARTAGLVIPVANLGQEILVSTTGAALCGAFTLAMIVQTTSAW